MILCAQRKKWTQKGEVSSRTNTREEALAYPGMSRAVGNALHKNPDSDNIPCYRVVNSKGELAGEYAFGGAWAQKELLEADGIEVVNGRVDLVKYGMN
jgi:alkylated DNA nucleotide flippase Atl1